MGEHAVEITNLHKQFGKHTVLAGIDLTIDSGEIVGLIGPSGAGKTTLIKAMMGMDLADQGSVEIFGTAIPNREIFERIGYMAQSDALYTSLSGRENLRFFGELLRVAKSKLKQRIEYVSSVVDLTDDLDKRVEDYSGGMKRRLSLAIALIQNPDLVILDEPTVGIDPELRMQVWEELNRLKAEGKAIIVTTHVMDEAERCDYLMLIRDGHGLTHGTPADLKAQFHVQTIEEVFLKAGRVTHEN